MPRGRPKKEENEQSNLRQRPPHMQGERSEEQMTLDAMESAAKQRIAKEGLSSITAKNKLDWSHKENGYEYIFASDSPTYPISLQEMLDAGYTLVRYEHGAAAGNAVVKNSVSCKLYLLKIPEELFRKQEEEKHARSRARMGEIRKLGKNEYGGDSQEIGKGDPLKIELTENPDVTKLMG